MINELKGKLHISNPLQAQNSKEKEWGAFLDIILYCAEVF
jgi:hypothetical protein